MVSSRERTKSKRKGYRFDGQRILVTLKTAFADGQAYLANISTTGCALESPTVAISPSEKILVTIALAGEKEKVEAAGRVVRVEKQLIAVRFTVIEDATVRLIQAYFFRKLRNQR